MHIETQVKQLTVLVADLIPTVDRLAHGQEQNIKAIQNLTQRQEQNARAIQKLTQNQERNDKRSQQLTQSVAKIGLGLSEMRTSNLRLVDTIEKLIVKIDRLDQFETRLYKVERGIKK